VAAEGERRRVRVLGCSPNDRVEAAMLTLPPVASVVCEGTVVADHSRCWGHHQSIADTVQAQDANALRHDPPWSASSSDRG
jgi:hypothetical protein